MSNSSKSFRSESPGRKWLISAIALASGCLLATFTYSSNLPNPSTPSTLDELQVIPLPLANANAIVGPQSSSQTAAQPLRPKAVEMGRKAAAAIARLRENASLRASNSISARTPSTQSATVISPTTGNRTLRQGAKSNAVQFSGGAAPSFAQHSTLSALAYTLQKPMHVSLNAHGAPREIRVQRSTAGLNSNAPGSASLQSATGEPMTTAMTFLNSNTDLLRLKDAGKEMHLKTDSMDRLGRRHMKFEQYYEDVPVWGASLILHFDKQGNLDLVNGAFIPTPSSLQVTPVVEDSEAIALAQAFVADGGTQTVLGPAKLVVYPGDPEIAELQDPRLAWQVRITTDFAHYWMVLVDANNGAKLKAYNEVMTAGNVAGSGTDLFGDTQSVNVYEQNGTFFMVDTSKMAFDPTSTPPAVATTRGGIVILDAGNQPGNPQQEPIPQNQVTSSSATSGWLPDAVSASFGFSETYDYFWERHQRNGLDGQGSTIQATVRVGQNFLNAFFIGAQQAMFFGDAVPFAGALDVVGHELAHGVVNTTSNLIYENQSGALNESFSDIFGTAVQARTNGAVDWVIGDQTGDIRLFRDMENPSRLMSPLGVPYPMRMSQFVFTNDDNGGVHVNSSIPNHAFYLLAAGLPNAIGLNDSELIFFRAFTVHLQQRSQFIDARLASIRAAEEIFGVGSTQAIRTAEAFDAVEIFDAPSTPGPSPFPEVQGPDAVIAVATDPNSGANLLVRREEALGDTVSGSVISNFGVFTGGRPSITGDGTVAAFVNSFNDLCIIETNPTQDAFCLGFPGSTHSLTISPDGTLLASILLDQFGNADNVINVTELATGETVSFGLVADALDGVSANLIAAADAMDFSSTGQFLIYDALNDVRFGDGSQLALWSVFALDLVTGRTLTLIPPTPGLVISFPTISQTSDNFFTFDVFDTATGQSTVLAANLNTGALAPVATITQGFGVPAYSGDDSAIVYSQFDPSVPTQFSLLRQAVAEDRITPVGAPQLFLSDADFATIYRRGQFSGALDVDLSSTQSASTTAARVGQAVTFTVNVANQGTDVASNVSLTNTLPTGASITSLSSSQGTCNAQADQFSCTLGSMGAASTAVITLDLVLNTVGMQTNASNLVAGESETDTANNSSFVTVVVSEVNSSSPDVGAPGAAVLPGSRSVQVGTTATAFATVLNTTSATIEGCGIALLDNLPASFFFQTTDPATNALTGVPNTPVTLAPSGSQTFIFGLTPTAPFSPTAVSLGFDCANTPQALVIDGVNTLFFSASAAPVADLVALGATTSGDGILNLPGNTGSAAFAIASVNVGAGATITVTPDTNETPLPLNLSVCETNPATAACLAPPSASVTTTINAGATPTFTVFATGSDAVAFDPANSRIRVQFVENGQVRGSTSVAVRTQ